ncbi:MULTISPECIES: hypothetical protein [unclassified Rhizobium]|uniref:hypothetical protein n=1 Tax=unclassified Rhizobium TaxID=2613769 RepID=UPI0007EA7FD7|nr:MULTISPECIES: hypothetical protein [unclassified Rhizobium]ANM09237.1 hypothetical protein AMK05_CH00808 [Rhizobium sp. N324]OYD02805.1 hypothetical protein AMK08_CH100804 [Rhizobium sp. N4311]
MTESIDTILKQYDRLVMAVSASAAQNDTEGKLGSAVNDLIEIVSACQRDTKNEERRAFFNMSIAKSSTVRSVTVGGKGGVDINTIVATMLIYLIGRHDKRMNEYIEWETKVQSTKRDKTRSHSVFSYMTEVIANSIVDGAGHEGKLNDASTKLWSIPTAHLLLSNLVSILGEAEVENYVILLRDRLVGAVAKDARREVVTGYAVPDGAILVSVMGLRKFAGLVPSDPGKCREVFAEAFSDYPETLGDLPDFLEGSTYLWAGSDDSEARRVLAQRILTDMGWYVPWEQAKARVPPAEDRLVARLRSALPEGSDREALALAFPENLAGRVVERDAASIIRQEPVDTGDPTTIPDSWSRAKSRAGFRLAQLDERYTLKPLNIFIVGNHRVGKSTFLAAILHEFLRGEAKLIAGRSPLVSARGQTFFTENSEKWLADKPISPTLISFYGISLLIDGWFQIELFDHRGELLHAQVDRSKPVEVRDEPDLHGGGEAALIAPGTKEEDNAFSEALSAADGAIFFVNSEDLRAVAGRNEEKVNTQRDKVLEGLNQVSERLTRFSQLRTASSNIPIATVVNKSDLLFDADDWPQIYSIGALIGDKLDRSEFGDKDVHEALKNWAYRTPLGTISLGTQARIKRVVDLMSKWLTALMTVTRRYEVFFTSAKAFPFRAKPRTEPSGAGPLKVLQWAVASIAPAYLHQMLKTIDEDLAQLDLIRAEIERGDRIAGWIKACDEIAGSGGIAFVGVYRLPVLGTKRGQKSRDKYGMELKRLIDRYEAAIQQPEAAPAAGGAPPPPTKIADYATANSEMQRLKERHRVMKTQIEGLRKSVVQLASDIRQQQTRNG